MATHLIILAAGAGTRMLSDRPKVLHEIAGAPMFVHSLVSASELDGQRVIIVGHGGEDVARVAKEHDEDILVAKQSEQLGTAQAVLSASEALSDVKGDTVVLLGDTHFIRPETLGKMQALRADGADVVFLGFEPDDPARYGRMVTDGDKLLRIVEWKEASEEEREITLCNAGVVMAETETLLRSRTALRQGHEDSFAVKRMTQIVELRSLATTSTAAE